MKNRIAPLPQSDMDADQRACLTNQAFRDAIRDSDFRDTLREAALGNMNTGYEHSFAYGPALWFGPDILSNPRHIRNSGASDAGPAGLVRTPRIVFHTHRNAAPMLSGADRAQATNQGYPIVAYDVDDGTFRCALP